MVLVLLIVLQCCLLITHGQSQPRIIGGNKVTNRSLFPFQVSIRHYRQHFCGGVIITIDSVLTAAHCGFVHNDERINVAHMLIVVGDLQLEQATNHTRMFSVKSMKIHPAYNEVTLSDDIAIIKIYGLFEWNDYVSPIRLAINKPTPKTPCVISGWGTQHQEQNELPDTLYYANITVIDDGYCKNYIKAYVPYHNGMLCAGQVQGGVDSCRGDSGGPLICNNELAGIISWGIGCAAPEHPGVHMDISYYNSWINAKYSNSWIVSSSLILLFLGKILLVIL